MGHGTCQAIVDALGIKDCRTVAKDTRTGLSKLYFGWRELGYSPKESFELLLGMLEISSSFEDFIDLIPERMWKDMQS